MVTKEEKPAEAVEMRQPAVTLISEATTPATSNEQRANPPSSTTPQKSFFTEALVIAAFPLVAYLMTYAYETGIAIHFDYPFELINPSWTHVFLAMMLLVIMFACSIFIADRYYSSFKDLRHPSHAFLYLVFFISVTICTSRWHWHPIFSLIAAMASMMTTSVFILDYYAERHQQHKDGTNAADSGRLSDTFFAASLRTKRLAVILIVLVGFTFSTGSNCAKYQQQFYTITTPTQQVVVLRIYGDRLICKPFDRKTHKLLQPLTILSLTDKPTMTLERLGEIHQ